MKEIHDLFDKTIFPELKDYILAESIYSPYVFKLEPEAKVFPLVVVKEDTVEGNYTTLDYSDYIYPFNLDINVYAVQKGNVANATICYELCSIIEKFFYERYRMRVKVNRNAPNIDTSIHRSIITVSCKIDTKYEDKLVIYP